MVFIRDSIKYVLAMLFIVFIPDNTLIADPAEAVFIAKSLYCYNWIIAVLIWCQQFIYLT